MNIDFLYADWNLFDKIKPFFKNVVKTVFIDLPDTFNISDIKEFCNKSAYEVENNLKSVSF